MLLVQPRAVVSADRLIDILWGERPPAAARQGLWTCVARLRHALQDPTGPTPSEVLVTQAPGYLLAVEPEQVDAGLFERLVAEASGMGEDRPRAAGEILDQALDLWRGPALVEFADEPFAAAEAARLDELRLVAMERRFDVDLAVGAHAELVGQLRAFTALHPLRERPRGQLMLALYRCGRQAEALEAFTAYRHLLEDELGLEPSESLRAQQAAILRQAAELDEPPVPAEELDGGAPDLLIEAQEAPAEATSFVGRVDDIAEAAARIRRGAAGHAHRDRRRGQDAPRQASRRRCVRPVRRWCLVVRAGPTHGACGSRPGAGDVARRPPATRCWRRRLDRPLPRSQAAAPRARQLRTRPRWSPTARRGHSARLPTSGGGGDESGATGDER